MNVFKEKFEPKERIFDLSGMLALVTGGASGLGKIFCEVLARFGADIVIADIDEYNAKQTAEVIQNLGRRCGVVKADVSQLDEVKKIVDETLANFETIDILINNAGIATKKNFIAEMSLEDWDNVIAVDLKGVFLCTRAVLPVMLRQGRGNIINISSVYGIRHFFEIGQMSPSASYAVAKAGVISLTKETALQYARNGIRVNCIAPGWQRGTNLGKWIEAAGKQEWFKKYEEMVSKSTPMGRWGDPTELRGLIVYLASNASSFVTGQVFISDGGISL